MADLRLSERHHGRNLPAHIAIRVKRLEFLAVPDTQECDILSSASHRNEVISAVARKLHEMCSKWDVLELSYLPAESDTQVKLPAALAHCGPFNTSMPAGRNLSIALDGSWESFHAARSRSLKKASNFAANRLKKTGKIDLRQIGANSNDAAIDTMVGDGLKRVGLPRYHMDPAQRQVADETLARVSGEGANILAGNGNLHWFHLHLS